MTPRNTAFAPGSQTPFLEQSEEKWHSIEPSALGIPADITRVADDLWQRQREGRLSDEELWEQGRALGLRVLDVLGDGFNFHVFVGRAIRPVATPKDRKDSGELTEQQLEGLSGGKKTHYL